MRIAMIAPPWVPIPPPAYGGTEAVVDRLARGFAAGGHDVLLWTTGDSTCPVPRAHVLERSEPDRMGLAAIELRHLIGGYDRVYEWGADIVHDHTLIGPIMAARHREVAVVTTNHGPFNDDLNDLYRTISGEVAIIAISHDQASHAVGVDITAVIHHGLDLDEYPLGAGTGDDNGPYHLFLGRMAPEKGARRAAQAALEAGVRLKIAAKMREPWEHQFFADQVKPLLNDRVVYVGEVGGTDKVRLLAGATSLVNPILWAEPFGLVMIEALASGTPVLAFPQGAAPEIVDHGVTGFLCDDVADVAARLAEAGDLDRSACRRAAEERFSTARMVSDHVALFERLLAERAA